MANRLTRTLSSKFKKEEASAFPAVPVDSAVRTGAQRKIKAKLKIIFHGAQNIFSQSDQDVATLHWKRGTKKANAGNTLPQEVVFGMSTWKHSLFLECTFFQDKNTKSVDPKPMSLALKVANGRNSKKTQTVGNATLDLADFYRDGLRVDKMIPISPGSNPTTLKVTIETQWLFIDGKLIVRDKSGRARSRSGAAAAVGGAGEGGDVPSEDEYDLKTVTFDSEDEMSVGGSERIEFSEDDESIGGGSAAAAARADQTELVEQLRREIDTLKAANTQLQGDCKQAEDKVETYRATMKTKNDQIAALKATRDEKIALLAAQDAKLSSAEERAIALQSKLDATFRGLKEKDEKNERDRQHFEKELRELRARNEELHQRMTADVSSNATFLQQLEKQTAEAAATLKAERSARRKADKALAAMSRHAQSMSAELAELKGATAAEAVAAPAVEVIGSGPSLEDERNDLQEKIRALTAELHLLRAECDTYKAQVADAQDRLLNQGAAHESEVSRLTNERDAAKRHLAEAESRVRALEREATTLKTTCDGLQARNVALAESVRESLEGRAQAQSALLELRELQSKLGAEISAKQRDLTQSAALQTQRLEELRSQAAAQLQQMELAHTQEKEDLRAQVARLEKTIADQQQQQQHQAGVAQEQLTPRTVVDAALALGKDVGSSEAAGLKQHFLREKMEYERIAERAREDTRRAEEEAARHERRATNVEKSLNESRKLADEAKRRATEAQAQLAALQATVQEKESAFQETQKQSVVVMRRVAEIEASLRDREDATQQLELRLAAATRAAESATKESQAAERRATMAEHAAEELRRSHKTELSAIRDKLSEARAEARNAADQLKAASAERDASVRKLALLETEIGERVEAERELSELLSTCEGKLRGAMRVMEAAEEGRAKAQATVTQLQSELAAARSTETEAHKRQQQESAAAQEQQRAAVAASAKLVAEAERARAQEAEKLAVAETARKAMAERLAELEKQTNLAGEREKQLSERVDELQSQVASDARTLEDLRGKGASVEESVAAERTRAAQAEAAAAALRTAGTALRKELATSKDALAAAQQQVTDAQAALARERTAVAELVEKLATSQANAAALQQRVEALEVELDGRSNTARELGTRLEHANAQAKTADATATAALARERQRADELATQVAALHASEVELKRLTQALREDARSADEHAKQTEALLQRKNQNLAKLEGEVQATEAELQQLESQVALLKKQATEHNLEAQSQRDRADASALLLTQLQVKFEQMHTESAAQREAHVRASQAAEDQLHEARAHLKEAQHTARSVEAERDALTAQCTELEAALRFEKGRAANAEQLAERVPELEDDLALAVETLRAADLRLKQLREASGDLGAKVEQLSGLEKEKRERKLVISAVLLGANDDAAVESVRTSTAQIVDSLREWNTLSGEGDAACLHKIGNGYAILLQSGVQSYYHCVRVLAQLCNVSHALRSEFKLAINDPSVAGVALVKKRAKGAPGAVEDFLAKMEHTTERAAVALGAAVFRRLNPYLAPAILNHMPPQDANKIEETVVDSGNERGKFMSHTVMSTLTDVRDWMLRYGLPELVVRQLFVTLAHNLNAYLFQYLIQTPAICTPTNAFTIKTRLGLLDDWFAQDRNAAFKVAYEQMRPMDEAAVLLFVDRSSFTDWNTIRSLCPALNVLQVLSLVEMLQVDETQKQPLAQNVRDDIDARVGHTSEPASLFFRPADLLELP